MVWYVVLFLLSGSALAAGKSLVLVDAPFLTVDQNGNASATITLRNDTGADIPHLRLNLSDFMHKRPDGKAYPLGTTHTLVAVNDREKPILDGKDPLATDATLSVRVTVTKLREAGQSEAILKNGDTDIPMLGGLPQSSLKAIRIPAAYNVQIISPTPDTPEIHFVRDRALVGLKNSDPFTYRLAWKLRLNGQLFDGGQNFIDLPPGASKYVYLERPTPKTDVLAFVNFFFNFLLYYLAPLAPHPNFPDPSALVGETVLAYQARSAPPTNFPEPDPITAGTLKDEIVKGDLVLQPVFEGDAVTQPLPSKNLPVTFRLSYWSDNVQQFWNVFWTFLLLALGGVFSICVHAGVPNTTRAHALRKRINDLETKIRGLGASIDSRWRVLLESHLPAIRRELFSMPWIFPSFATTLDGLTKKVDMLQQWVDIAYDASVVLHQADPDQSMHLIPPTVLQWIKEKCTHALTPIESGLTTDAEIEAMKADLKAAQNYLTATVVRAHNADLEKEIKEREDRLKPVLAELETAQSQFPGLVKQVTEAIGKPLSPVDYIERDVGSLKVDLLWEFDQRMKQLAKAPPNSPAAKARLRLQAYGTRLMKYLVADTHESLRVALLIVHEIHQDIYPEALSKELTPGPPAVMITTDPAAVQAQSPVRLALRFNRRILNEAVARHEWTYTWDFGDNTPHEDGWAVFHSYKSPGKPQVQVKIRNLDANLVIVKPVTRTITIGNAPERSQLRRRGRFIKLEPETRLELVRLVIVLALALLGLMTTARQQVQHLSFLEAVGAVVALGFGANTIKNLILQRASSS